MKLSQREQQVTPSLTLAIDSKAKAMKAEGIDIISLSAGEPDFDTPLHIKEAAQKALQDGKTRYGPVAGEPKLKIAIANKLHSENGLDLPPENIIVTNGGKHSLYGLIMAIIDPGDEVIIPAPYWVSYPEMVKLAGGIPVIVHTENNGYKITPDQLKSSITPKTKLFVLNSPSNPTGVVYSPEELKALADIIVEHDLLVVSDEIYEKIVYDGVKQISIASLNSEIFKRTLISNGFAKGYAMTGWRIGYLAGDINIIKAVSKIQGHSTSNVCTFAQYGAITALESDQECVEIMRLAFTERRKFILERVNSIPNISCVKPDGAFYVFLNIGKTGMDSLTFCEQLLESEKLAVIPGIAFGCNDHIRLSYATDLISLEKALDRLEKFITSLSS